MASKKSSVSIKFTKSKWATILKYIILLFWLPFLGRNGSFPAGQMAQSFERATVRRTGNLSEINKLIMSRRYCYCPL
jgi:hypothetical protein